MAKVIYKKILPQYFSDVCKGVKDFELRKDEDDIQVGDIIVLLEYDGDKITGREIVKKVKYVLRNCTQYGLMDGFCIIGLGMTLATTYNPKDVYWGERE